MNERNEVYIKKPNYEETLQHQCDVKNVGRAFVLQMLTQLKDHDSDKIVNEKLNEVYFEFIKQGFKQPHAWTESHLKLPHHSPENLIDLIEYLIDGIVAAMRRKKNGIDDYTFRDFGKLDLKEIVTNTEKLLLGVSRNVLRPDEEESQKWKNHLQRSH
jgi:hypothetical protein